MGLLSRYSWRCGHHNRFQLFPESTDCNDYEISYPGASQRWSNLLERHWPFFVVWVCREFGIQWLVLFLSSRITWLVDWIPPKGCFSRTPSFLNISFMDSPNPLTRHSYLLQTLHSFIHKRGLTCGQSVPLRSTHSSYYQSPSVYTLMCRCPIHLPPLEPGSQWCPHRYPARTILSDRLPRSIQCYLMCSIDSSPWCCDATTLATIDDQQSNAVERWEFCLYASKFMRIKAGWLSPLNWYGECVLLTQAPCFQLFVPNTLGLLSNLIFRFKHHIVGVKPPAVYLSMWGKMFLCHGSSPGPGISRFSCWSLCSSFSAFFLPSGASRVCWSSVQPFHFTKYRRSLSSLFLPQTFCL